MAVSFFIAAAAPAMQPAFAAAVKIALIEPLSGPAAASGQAMAKQFQTIAELANRGKWAGDNTFEIDAFDNKGSPQESLVVLKSVIDHGYRYVAQGVGSGAALALLEAINKHNERNPGKEVVLLNYAAQDPDMTNSKCSFWHFRFEANTDMRVEALTTYMARDRNIGKLYLIHQNYAYGHQNQRAVKEYLKRKRPDIQIVGDDLHGLGQVKDFSPYVAKIKASGADTVYTANWGNDFALLVKALKESGAAVNIYSGWVSSTGISTVMGESGVDRVKSIASWHVNNETFSGKEIVEAHKKKFNEDFVVPGIYNTVAVFAQAIRTAGSAEPVRVAFTMEGMKIKGLAGEIEMRGADHQLQQPLYLIGWVKTNGKDVKYDQENTGFGWKTSQKFDTYVASQPTSCQMKRPAR
jgi:branched-chain amino acid transport system substrate-binding protein